MEKQPAIAPQPQPHKNGSTDKLTQALVDAIGTTTAQQTEEITGRFRGALDDQTAHLTKLVGEAVATTKPEERMTLKKKIFFGAGGALCFGLGIFVRGLFNGRGRIVETPLDDPTDD